MSDAPERWLSELYRASAREEPPALLDARILATARKDVRVQRLHFLRWRAPLAAAAVVVVTVSLVIAMRDDIAFTDPPPRFDMARPAAPVSPPAAAEPEQGQSHREQATPGVAGPRGEPKVLARPALEPAAEKQNNRRADVATAQPGAKAAADGRAEASTPSAAAPPPTAVARDQVPAPAEQASASHPDVLGKIATPDPPVEQRQRAADASNDLGSRSEPERRLAREEARAPRTVTAERDASPAAWLERILKLRSEGRILEAKQCLAAFRQRYPQHPLPDALKEW